MFTKFSNSWNLVKASWQVLKADKELIIFPLLSFVALTIVTIGFFVPIFLFGYFNLNSVNDSKPFLYLLGFLMYFICYAIIIFSNTALVSAALIRMRGRNPSLADGFNFALKRIRQILGYALISATVGIILKALSERGGLFGKIASAIANMAWNIVTFLVIPVLVVENIGPIDAIKRSAQLLKKTWGEQLIGNFSIGFVFGLMIFSSILISIPIFILAASAESVLIVIFVALLLMILIVGLIFISTTLSSIYEAALYLYAVTGKTGGYFDGLMLQEAFRQK